MPAGANPSRPSASQAPAPRRPQPAVPNANPAGPAPSNRGGFATLGSLRGSASDDDESGKNYYAGGEKSGQMIQDPRKKGRPGSASGAGRSNPDANPPAPTNLTDAIFERARARGPRSEEEREQFEGDQTFTGAGYRLGDNATTPTPSAIPDVIGRRNITRNLTFYANGFTIDDGPLRRFDDPQNEAFLNDVNRGVVPREMEEPGVGDVSITLIDKKGEEYVPPKKKIVPFSGGGQRLNAGPSTVPPATNATVDTDGAAASVEVDESRPIATVQVRLSDGTRLMARLNEDNTVGDLRAYVAASRPGITSFTLSTTYPRTVLEDDTLTIKEAKLKGAVVLQSLK